MNKKSKATIKPQVAKEQTSFKFSLYFFLFFTTILLLFASFAPSTGENQDD